MHKKKILIVEDSKGLVYIIAEFLQNVGYYPLCTYNGKDAICSVLKETPSLAIVDIGLPDISGLSVIERIKEINSKVPIIAISGPKDIEKEIAMYKKGIVLFHKKPLHLGLLEVQIKNLLPNNKNNTIQIKDIKIDIDIGIIIKNNVRIPLTKNELSCLTYLIEAQGCLCSRESILRRLNFNPNDKTEHSVDTLVCRLRKKLGHTGIDEIIETVNGKGYRILTPREG